MKGCLRVVRIDFLCEAESSGCQPYLNGEAPRYIAVPALFWGEAL